MKLEQWLLSPPLLPGLETPGSPLKTAIKNNSKIASLKKKKKHLLDRQPPFLCANL